MIQEENGETSAVFVLEDSESTRQMWNYRSVYMWWLILDVCNLIHTMPETKGLKCVTHSPCLNIQFCQVPCLET